MAIFGDLGKTLGLGTAKQTFAGAAQGALRGAVFGQPFMGAASGALTTGTQPIAATASAHHTPNHPPKKTHLRGEHEIAREISGRKKRSKIAFKKIQSTKASYTLLVSIENAFTKSSSFNEI